MVRQAKVKVFGNKSNGQLIVNLPKKKFTKVKPGDYVKISVKNVSRGGKKNGKKIKIKTSRL